MTRPDSPLDATQFTRESAERIGRVVRAAEQAVPPAAPLRFEPWFGGTKQKQVRAAKFSGVWPVGVSKTVAFAAAPTGTAVVMNLSWPLTHPYTNEDCLIGREGTNWWLIVPVLEERTAVMVTRTVRQDVLTGVTVNGSFDGTACSISITATTAGTSLVVIASSFTSAFYRARKP